MASRNSWPALRGIRSPCPRQKKCQEPFYRRPGQQATVRFKNTTDSFMLYNQSEPCPNQNQSKLVIIEYQNSYPREKEVSDFSISSERPSERPGLREAAVAAVTTQRFRTFQKAHALPLLSEKAGDVLCSELPPKRNGRHDASHSANVCRVRTAGRRWESSPVGLPSARRGVALDSGDGSPTGAHGKLSPEPFADHAEPQLTYSTD